MRDKQPATLQDNPIRYGNSQLFSIETSTDTIDLNWAAPHPANAVKTEKL